MLGRKEAYRLQYKRLQELSKMIQRWCANPCVLLISKLKSYRRLGPSRRMSFRYGGQRRTRCRRTEDTQFHPSECTSELERTSSFLIKSTENKSIIHVYFTLVKERTLDSLIGSNYDTF